MESSPPSRSTMLSITRNISSSSLTGASLFEVWVSATALRMAENVFAIRVCVRRVANLRLDLKFDLVHSKKVVIAVEVQQQGYAGPICTGHKSIAYPKNQSKSQSVLSVHCLPKGAREHVHKLN